MTQRKIRSLPAGRHYQGQGLVLIITATSRRWAFRYTSLVTRKPTEKAIGSALVFTEGEARGKIIEYRKLMADGKDPVQAKREQKAAGVTFKQAAEGFIEHHQSKWRSLRHVNIFLHKHGAPLANKPVSTITSDMIDKALSNLYKRHPEQARRVMRAWAQVFDFAKAKGYRSKTEPNPAEWEGNLENIFPALPQKEDRHYPQLPFKHVPAFIERLRLRLAKGNSAAALEFQILTAARPGEAQGARWSEFDLINRIWTIPATRTKQKRPHRVPLTERCMWILSLQNEYRNGRDFVFPGYNHKALNSQAVRALLLEMGFTPAELVPSGFRKSFRNWCAHTRQDRDLSELCLAHKITKKLEGSYWTEDMLEQRRVIMQEWGDYCG